MTKEEFLAMSLPYGVKAISVEVLDCIWTIHPYKDALDTLMDNEHLSYENFIKENSHKLILRPLTDLIKPITQKGYNNGEPFVPIVELAKIAQVKIKPSDCSRFQIDSEFFKYSCKLSDFLFWFDEKGFFGWVIVTSKKEHKLFVENQLQLFQLLISWHFNLMNDGEEFIDVNTLPENPYK